MALADILKRFKGIGGMYNKFPSEIPGQNMLGGPGSQLYPGWQGQMQSPMIDEGRPGGLSGLLSFLKEGWDPRTPAIPGGWDEKLNQPDRPYGDSSLLDQWQGNDINVPNVERNMYNEMDDRPGGWGGGSSATNTYGSQMPNYGDMEY